MVVVLYGSQFGKDFEVWTEGGIKRDGFGEKNPKREEIARQMKG